MNKIIVMVCCCLFLVSCKSTMSNFGGVDYGDNGFKKEIKTDTFSGKTTYSYFTEIAELREETTRKSYYIQFNPILLEEKESKKLAPVIVYTGESWIFIEKVQLKINDEEPIEIPNIKMLRNVAGSRRIHINEAHGLLIKYELFEKMANANNVAIRLIGKNGVRDIQLTGADKQGIRWILETYQSIQKKDITDK